MLLALLFHAFTFFFLSVQLLISNRRDVGKAVFFLRAVRSLTGSSAHVAVLDGSLERLIKT